MDEYNRKLREFGKALSQQGPPRDLKGKHSVEWGEQFRRWEGLFEPLSEEEMAALGYPHRSMGQPQQSRIASITPAGADQGGSAPICQDCGKEPVIFFKGKYRARCTRCFLEAMGELLDLDLLDGLDNPTGGKS